jgi:uncharacterized protein (DUF433 family)
VTAADSYRHPSGSWGRVAGWRALSASDASFRWHDDSDRVSYYAAIMTKAPDRTPWDGIIVTDAGTCFGKARIAGTRMYLDHFLAHLEHGGSIDSYLADYDHISRGQLQAAIGFTRDLVAAKRNRLKPDPTRAIEKLAPVDAD